MLFKSLEVRDFCVRKNNSITQPSHCSKKTFPLIEISIKHASRAAGSLGKEATPKSTPC